MRREILHLFIAIVALSSIACHANAQGVAVNATGTAADGSAIFDASSTTQGMLIPRMNNGQMTGISSPIEGLLLYCTDCTPVGFYYYTGSAWTSLNSLSNVTTQGNTFNGAGQLVQLNGSSQLPVADGNQVTNLNAANLGTGTVPTARMGSGTASTSTYLRGDNTWHTVGGTGTVTSVSSNVLTSGTTAFTDTIFHTIVIGPTTTPSIFYSFNNAAAYSVLTNNTALPSIPTYAKVVPQALSAVGGGTPSSSTYYRGDGSWQSISSGGYCFSGTAGGSTSSPVYMALTGASNSSPQGRYIVPASTAMTFDAIYTYGYCTATAAGTGSTFTLTLYVNGSPTALTCTITAPSTAAVGNTFTANLTGASVSVSAGDLLQLVYTAGSPSTGPFVVTNTSLHAH